MQPNIDDTGSSSLHTGGGRITNVAIQDICPNDTNEHLLVGLIDPVAYALAVDALGHDGPADRSRVDPTVCAQQFHPGINPATFPADSSAAAADYESYQATDVPAEPPLACYTTATCPAGSGSQSGSGSSSIGPAAKRCTRRTRFTLRVRALRRVRASVGGKRVAVKRRRHKLTVAVDLARFGTRTVKVKITGRDKRGHKVRITRTYRGCGATG